MPVEEEGAPSEARVAAASSWATSAWAAASSWAGAEAARSTGELATAAASVTYLLDKFAWVNWLSWAAEKTQLLLIAFVVSFL